LIISGDPVSEKVRAWAEAQWRRPSVQSFVQMKRPSL
jgi:hypothetical protein